MKKLLTFIFAFTMLLTASGCGKYKENWAYIHDPKVTVLSLSDDGKAIYKGTKYSYTKDDSYIDLKGEDGSELKLRYIADKDGMILYEKTTYTFDGEGTPDGITGVWKQDNGWVYRFTEKGTFSEEDIFYGHYIVDEENSSIKLMYDEPIEDAILYYELKGNELIIDYPWPMVKTEE